MTAFAIQQSAMTATESLFLSDPELVAGYLNDTAKRLADKLTVAESYRDSFRSEVDNVRATLSDLYDKRQRFVDALTEWAKRESVDSEFDDILSRFGFDTRQYEYRVEVSRYRRILERATVFVTAADEDSANEDVESQYRNGILGAEWESDSYNDEYDAFDVESVELDEDD